MNGLKHKYNKIFGNSGPKNPHKETKFGNYHFFYCFHVWTMHRLSMSEKSHQNKVQVMGSIFIRNPGQ